MATVDLEKTGCETGPEPEFLDDSGPYEEIPEEDPKTDRPPIGRLPSFISLDSKKNFEVDGNVVHGVNHNVDENVKMEEQQEIEIGEIDERLIWDGNWWNFVEKFVDQNRMAAKLADKDWSEKSIVLLMVTYLSQKTEPQISISTFHLQISQ